MKNILKGHITIKIFDSNGENPFFGKKIVKKVVTVVLSLNRSFEENNQFYKENLQKYH